MNFSSRAFLSGLLGFVSFSVSAETYECFADLTQIGRPGEVEATTYTRNSHGFAEKMFWGEKQAIVALENERHIILIRPQEYGALMSSFIDKKNMEFGTHAISIDWLKEGKRGLFGKCIRK